MKRRLKSGQSRRQRGPRVTRKAGLPEIVKAPPHLSLFDNPEETIRYCEDVRRRASKPNAEVFLDFSDVIEFTTDALLLIRAIMDKHDKKGVVRHPAVFSGNLPMNQKVAAEFKGTGFFSPENSWRVPIPVQTQEPPCGTSAVLTTTCATTEALA